LKFNFFFKSFFYSNKIDENIFNEIDILNKYTIAGDFRILIDKILIKFIIKNYKLLLLFILVSIPIPIFLEYILNNYKNVKLGNVVWTSWYDNPSNEVFLGFQTGKPEIATIYYGLSLENPIETKIEPESMIYHILNISNLIPDTKYYYKIEINNKFYAQGEFRTAPVDFTPFMFCLTSDTQPKLGEGWHSLVARKISEFNNSFVAMIGDFVEDGYEFEWFNFFNRASIYLKNTPLVPVRGNHDRPRDLNNDGIEEYFFEKYFPQSDDQIINTNIYDKYKQFYFSFNWSSVHFQILHFPEIDIDDLNDPNGVSLRDYYQSFTYDQIEWIKEDLRKAQSLPFRVTMFHCPIMSAGFYGPNSVLINELLPILLEYNVTVTIHGHSHHFERGYIENYIHKENPLNYFLVGTGGGLVDIGLRPIPETKIIIASPCFTEVFANATTLNFITYSPDGTILDNYIINKN